MPASPHASSTRCAPSRTGRWNRTPRRADARQPSQTQRRRDGDRPLASAATAKQIAAAVTRRADQGEEPWRGRAVVIRAVPVRRNVSSAGWYVGEYGESPPQWAILRHQVRDVWTQVDSRGENGRVSSSCYRQDAPAPAPPPDTRMERRTLTPASSAAAETLAAGSTVRRRPLWACRCRSQCRLGRGATTVSQHPLRPAKAHSGRRVGGGVSHLWVRGSAGPVVRHSVRDYPAQRQVFVGRFATDITATWQDRAATLLQVTSRCPSGGRGRWGGGGVRGRRRGWRCGRRGVGRR